MSSLRAALYVRVSTLDQHPDTYDLRQMAAQRGFEVLKQYTDRIGGAKARRPALDDLLADARKRNFDVVMVESLTDLAPSVQKCISVLEQLNQLGIGFVSYRPEIDTTGELGQGIAATVSALSQLERSLRIANVKAGMRRSKLEGIKIGRTPLSVDKAGLIQARLAGASLSTCGKQFGVSRAYVCRLMRPFAGKTNGTPAQTEESLMLAESA
jgi:DNA invertase Pin-like site-specific DNA recombinase